MCLAIGFAGFGVSVFDCCGFEGCEIPDVSVGVWTKDCKIYGLEVCRPLRNTGMERLCRGVEWSGQKLSQGTIQYITVQRSAVQHSTAQHSRAQDPSTRASGNSLLGFGAFEQGCLGSLSY